jgi:hypothetical protein
MWDLEDSSIDSVPFHTKCKCLTTSMCNPILQGLGIEACKCCDIVERILNLLVVASIVVDA